MAIVGTLVPDLLPRLHACRISMIEQQMRTGIANGKTPEFSEADP